MTADWRESVEAALYDTLAAHAPLTAFVGTRIFRNAAPEGATFPLVVYLLQGGGDDNLTPGRSFNLLYSLRAISETSAANAAAVSAAIDSALTGAQLSPSGWSVFWLAAESPFGYIELDRSGRRYWHAGTMFRVRIDS